MNVKEKEKLYTLRWLVREKWGESLAQDQCIDLLSQLLEDDSGAEDRPSVSEPDSKALWCPFAETEFPEAKTKGSYKHGYPEGAIVHFTAGHHRSLASSIETQLKNKLCYFVIDADGNIAQNFPLDSWGYHAGKSKWPGLGNGVSDNLVGIEVQCGGKLEKKGNKWQTWFGKTIPASERRQVQHSDNQQAGTYHKYTQAQEKALEALLLWLKKNNPEVFSLDLVLGHDEVSGPKGLGYYRKNDPGGSLSMTMSKYRDHLEQEYNKANPNAE